MGRIKPIETNLDLLEGHLSYRLRDWRQSGHKEFTAIAKKMEGKEASMEKTHLNK